LQKLANNEIDVLFVTPERLQTESFRDLVRTGRIPPITLACIDEVHCLTEWSHNFRTSYLSLGATLKELLGSPCILGLTGTSTVQTRDSICDMLSLPEDSVISRSVIRDNLKVTVSKVVDEDDR
jgi:ATP-dependent DNA helicase Q4